MRLVIETYIIDEENPSAGTYEVQWTEFDSLYFLEYYHAPAHGYMRRVVRATGLDGLLEDMRREGCKQYTIKARLGTVLERPTDDA